MGKKAVSSGFSLKDQLFNRERVTYLASLFENAETDFDGAAFIRDTMKRLKKLELKERIVHIAETLESYLPKNYTAAAGSIRRSLPPPLDPNLEDDDFGDFIFAPLGEFVVRNGLGKKHVKLSLRTLKQLTMRFSMEDAIRAFIDEHPEVTFETLNQWSTDRNYHVRRLVSEGTRPLLPWSKRLSIDYHRPLPLLDQLHADPTRYVTRSVSNHLNDIAKTDSSRVVKTLKHWKRLRQQEPDELEWMCRHALRTLIKRGDADALKMLGYRPNPKVRVSNFALTKKRLVPGEAIEFVFDLTAERDEALMIDYVIDFVKANGSTAPKVHKLKQLKLKRGESQSLSQKHTLRANATTYTLYPGRHKVTLQINGKQLDSGFFDLLPVT